jgi:hypothetical protein
MLDVTHILHILLERRAPQVACRYTPRVRRTYSERRLRLTGNAVAVLLRWRWSCFDRPYFESKKSNRRHAAILPWGDDSESQSWPRSWHFPAQHYSALLTLLRLDRIANDAGSRSRVLLTARLPGCAVLTTSMPALRSRKLRIIGTRPMASLMPSSSPLRQALSLVSCELAAWRRWRSSSLWGVRDRGARSAWSRRR